MLGIGERAACRLGLPDGYIITHFRNNVNRDFAKIKCLFISHNRDLKKHKEIT